MICYHEARFEEAEEFLQRAIKIDEKVLESRNSKTATKVHHLAVVLNDEGKYPQAEIIYRRAFSVREQNFPAADSEIGEIDNDSATLYDDEGKYPRAEPLYPKALAIREKEVPLYFLSPPLPKWPVHDGSMYLYLNWRF